MSEKTRPKCTHPLPALLDGFQPCSARCPVCLELFGLLGSPLPVALVGEHLAVDCALLEGLEHMYMHASVCSPLRVCPAALLAFFTHLEKPLLEPETGVHADSILDSRGHNSIAAAVCHRGQLALLRCRPRGPARWGSSPFPLFHLSSARDGKTC